VLLRCWQLMDPRQEGMTAAQVIAELYPKKQNPVSAPHAWYADMKAAVEDLVGKPDARLLGYRLRAYRRRIFEGLFIDKGGEQNRAARWVVCEASEFRNGPKHPRPSSSSSFATAGAVQECSPDQETRMDEDVSAQTKIEDDSKWETL